MLSIGQARPEKLRPGDRFAAFLWGFCGRLFSCLGPRFTFAFFTLFSTRLLRKYSNVKLITKNVILAFPDKSQKDQKKLIEDVVRARPLALAELMLQNYWRQHGYKVTQHNLDVDWLQPYARNDKQAIFALGHFSGWEPNIMQLSRHLQGIHGVYAAPKNTLLEPYFRERRTDFSGHWTLHPRDMKGLQALLAKKCAEGRSILYVLDAPLPGPMLPFLGLESPTTLRPYQLAARAGIPIIPVKYGRDRHRIGFWIEVQQPIFAKGKTYEDIVALATQMNDHYTAWILENPDQWYWTGQFFQPNRRWKAVEDARKRRQASSSTSQ